MSLQTSMYEVDANGVLERSRATFENIVSYGFVKGVIVWDYQAPPAEMIEAGWEILLGCDWDNLSSADVEEMLIAALSVRLP